MKKETRKKKKNGFTLIELMVSSSIFIIVMVVAIGAVLSIVDANRKAQTLSSVMTNLNFAVEAMVREINTGHEICSPAPVGCPEDESFRSVAISFISGEGGDVIYKLIDNPLGGKTLARETTVGPYANQEIPVTAPEVNINDMYFYIKGQGNSDGFQPIVMVVISGKVGISQKTQSNFRVQTLTTQRRLDS